MRGEQAGLRLGERQRGTPESETVFADLCHQSNPACSLKVGIGLRRGGIVKPAGPMRDS